jgi:uncharacterized damage-inducible protein DinB
MDTKMNELMVHQIETRLIKEGIHRVLSCVEKLSEEQLQYRPNANSNSINNQILHLNGNVRQWLISTLTDRKDQREREEEFDASNKQSKTALKEILIKLESDIREIYPHIIKSNLTDEKDVQCYRETILSIIIHVIEHFSYHLGQITYITKMLLDIDTGYYAGQELNKVN